MERRTAAVSRLATPGNLNTRGSGFEERILSVNRDIAIELGISATHAEAFEVEFYGTDGEEA